MKISNAKADGVRRGFRRKEKSCGAIIVSDTGRILIIHQQKGQWGFPKGHVESGETEEMTALREIKEEVGLDVELDTDFREVNTYSPCPGVIKDVVYFLGRPLSTKVTLQKEEVIGYEWVTIEGARNALTFRNDRLLIDKMEEYLKAKDAG
ncbi:MAG: NUDIX domain-containing protein [Clostridiales bacterium]|nr:NUDIX domain-containing protein [Clostridiales bacterium]